MRRPERKFTGDPGNLETLRASLYLRLAGLKARAASHANAAAIRKNLNNIEEQVDDATTREELLIAEAAIAYLETLL